MKDAAQTIALNARRTGSTTWIMEAAMRNPNIVVVFRDRSVSDAAIHDWNRMLFNLPWHKKLYRKVFKVGSPKFTTLFDCIPCRGLPVVFDNSCFI